MNSGMFCERILPHESFAALITLERLLPRVLSHVALQMRSCHTIVVAMVTLVGLFSCMLHHHVSFQITSIIAGKLAHCASVRLFPRVGPFVLLQIA